MVILIVLLSRSHCLTSLVTRNNWISNSLTLCAEISAAAIVIGFWNDTINQAAWITVILVLIICLNIFAVSIYGEAEFIFASVKIITIVGLLLLAFIIDLGGSPGDQGRLGFRYWDAPWAAMKAYVGVGNTGRFAGLFATLVNAAFSYGGVEMVAVAAGEAENPRKNIPKAVKRVFWRILFFYVLGSLAIGVIVPADDDRLLSGGAGAASSPWVIGIVRAGESSNPSRFPHIVFVGLIFFSYQVSPSSRTSSTQSSSHRLLPPATRSCTPVLVISSPWHRTAKPPKSS
jgi:amino acid transporter